MHKNADMCISLKVLKHARGMKLPVHATIGSAGLDLRAAITEKVVLKKFERKLIPTGIGIAIPPGYNGEVRSRSGLASKNGIVVLGSPGTIDSDYRGEVKVLLANLGDEDFTVTRGMRIAQLVVQRYKTVSFCVVDSLSETVRGEGGHGSTGIE
jgi:dUTP pyrophosphatase